MHKFYCYFGIEGRWIFYRSYWALTKDSAIQQAKNESKYFMSRWKAEAGQ